MAGEKKRGDILLQSFNISRLLLVLITSVIVLMVRYLVKNPAELQLQYQPLCVIGIISFLYAVILVIFNIHKLRIRKLGFMICIIDAMLIHATVVYSGGAASHYLLLYIFPLISLSILYRITGSVVFVILFLGANLYYLDTPNISISDIILTFVRLSLMAVFAIYLGNIGKVLKEQADASERLPSQP